MKRWVQTLLAAAVAVYVVPAAAFWAAQDALVFPAPTGTRGPLDEAARAVGATPIEATTEDGLRLYGWHKGTGARGVVIYFHGNAETVDGRWDLHDLALANGRDLVVFAYRGYPGSEGRPSEKGLHADARAAWKYVTETLHVPPEDVVLHGKSLGGGVAAALAAEVTPGALVLESTFTSIRRIVQRALPIYPVGLLLRHPFDTDRVAPTIKCPILLMHGDVDTVIPIDHGRALAKLLPQATYVEVRGAGHQETLPVVDPAARAAWQSLLR